MYTHLKPKSEEDFKQYIKTASENSLIQLFCASSTNDKLMCECYLELKNRKYRKSVFILAMEGTTWYKRMIENGTLQISKT